MAAVSLKLWLACHVCPERSVNEFKTWMKYRNALFSKWANSCRSQLKKNASKDSEGRWHIEIRLWETKQIIKK